MGARRLRTRAVVLGRQQNRQESDRAERPGPRHSREPAARRHIADVFGSATKRVCVQVGVPGGGGRSEIRLWQVRKRRWQMKIVSRGGLELGGGLARPPPKSTVHARLKQQTALVQLNRLLAPLTPARFCVLCQAHPS